jgi:pectinesterase
MRSPIELRRVNRNGKWSEVRIGTGFSILLLLVLTGTAFPFDSHYIVVAKDGSGDFSTITAAINALPMFNYERVVIYVKNGIYDEKIRMTQDYVTLKGESKDSTIIEYDQLRTDWIAHKDPIGPAVVNIHADDIVLENMTIRNTQPEVGPHAFAVYGTGTRIIILNCNVFSNGGDTVSLWDYKTGMYYHSHCSFRGAVDFVCPRGWCFIRDSKFYELKTGTASLWHAGGFDISQKFVVENSEFDGVSGFDLGRHHYEAQFYLLNCSFSDNMADTPIYHVTYSDPSKNRPFNWGERDYYYNCHRAGGDYKWFTDNLAAAAGSPTPLQVTPSWTFDGRWDPESENGPSIVRYEIHKNSVLLIFKEPITVLGKPVIVSKDGKTLAYDSGAGSDTLRFDSTDKISAEDLSGLTIQSGGKLLGTTASVHERDASLNIGI